MRKTIVLAATVAFAMSAGGASFAAAPCRDAKGKFIKCPASQRSGQADQVQGRQGQVRQVRHAGCQAGFSTDQRAWACAAQAPRPADRASRSALA